VVGGDWSGVRSGCCISVFGAGCGVDRGLSLSGGVGSRFSSAGAFVVGRRRNSKPRITTSRTRAVATMARFIGFERSGIVIGSHRVRGTLGPMDLESTIPHLAVWDHFPGANTGEKAEKGYLGGSMGAQVETPAPTIRRPVFGMYFSTLPLASSRQTLVELS